MCVCVCVCSNASRSAAIQTDGKPLTRAPVELGRCFCSFSLLSLSLFLSFFLFLSPGNPGGPLFLPTCCVTYASSADRSGHGVTLKGLAQFST